MFIEVKKLKLTFIWAVVLLIIVDALFVWPYAYRCGYGHGDVQSMEFALFFGLKNHDPLPDFAYGRDFSFGWYYLIFWLSKILKLKLNPETFPYAVNLLASLGSTVASICLLGVLAKFFTLTTALVAVILWRFIPEIWELSTYAHPWTVAMPFFVAGLWVYVAQIDSNEVTIKSPKFYFSCIVSTLLMTISLCIRADLVFFMPLIVAFIYFCYREIVLILITIMINSFTFFLLLRYFVVNEAQTSFIDFITHFARFERIPINLALTLYPISGYLLMIVATYLLTLKNKINHSIPVHLVVGAIALIPNLLFWLPIGPPLRHFAPLYITIAVLCAYMLVNHLRVPINLAVVTLLFYNMLVTELGFRIFSPYFPQKSVQIGVQRRVMESVTFGVPWLNHAAIQKLNELNEQYSVEALNNSKSSNHPVIFVQMDPYRLCVLAIHRFGTVRRFKSDDGLTVWQLGSSESAPWCIDIPDNADDKWLKKLQSFAKRHKRKLRFLGPRIPKALFTLLKSQIPN